MQLKNSYSDSSPWKQLFLMLMLILAGAFLSSFIGIGVFFLIYGFSANISDYPMMLLLAQLLSSLGTFLLPALGVAWFCSENPKEYLSFKRFPSVHLLALALISMLAISPFISLAEVANKELELPDFLYPIEQWMRQQEETAQQLTTLFISQKGIFPFLFNLLVIALAAGIGEKVFFRGALQRIIGKWWSNPHIIIWTVAILFSAFHLQFYGFFPRMLLGAFFGYLLLWTGNIWVPIFAHIANNSIALIVLSHDKLSQNKYLTGEIAEQGMWPYAAIAAISLIIFIVTIKGIREKGCKEKEKW